MSEGEIRLGDVGTVFEATIKDGSTVVDISGATTKQLIFKGPSGSSKTKEGAFTTTGTDGKLRYTTVAGDLDQAGVWSLQAYVVMTLGAWHSDIAQFTVHENL